MESTNSNSGRGFIIWWILVSSVCSWLIGYLTASAFKEMQYVATQREVESRVWEQIDSLNIRVTALGESISDLQGRAPKTYPPSAWLEDTFRPLVNRVNRLEKKEEN